MPRVIVRPRRGRSSPLLRGVTRILATSCMKKPGFSDTWTVALSAPDEDIVDRYEVDGSPVTICSSGTGDGGLYHIAPWEYDLPQTTLAAIRRTIDILANVPPASLSLDPTVMRAQLERSANDILSRELCLSSPDQRGEARRLAKVVGRYTIGLGVIETLLHDGRIEDIYLDSPVEGNCIHVTLNGVAGTNSVVRCTTNLMASEREMEALITRLRGTSNRPFSQAFPVLETDVPGFEARATVIGPPLSPMGRALAIRKHASAPWTLQRMVSNHTLDPLTAGLISFLVDGRSSILVCGSRGAGKSSLLSAAMFEFPSSQRILSIEDTRELPVRQMQEMGYKVQSMLVDRGVDGQVEDRTAEVLRVSLRLGESAIVLGEVRGGEARTLYQSMRTGKAGSSVLGTIHGDSSRSVYQRVVHDIGIPPEAFMATDVVITMGLMRPRGSQRQIRRLTEISESGEEPGEFFPLIETVDGEARVSGSSRVISRIAASWNITYDEAVENILSRAAIRSFLVERAGETPELLDPAWALRANQHLWALDGRCGIEETLSGFKAWYMRRMGVDGN